jgi:hypothetical protein
MKAWSLEGIMAHLEQIAPDLFTRVELAEPSLGGKKIHAIRLANGSGPNRRGFLMVGGVHARELMNPDAIVELLIDLLVAYRNKEQLSYGGRSWTWFELANIIHTLDIWAIPCANPDGREKVIGGDSMWRKNIRDTVDEGACPPQPPDYDRMRGHDGVDVNRNFDIAWGITGLNTSKDPCSDTYYGPEAHSEPETRNIVAFTEDHRIDTFVDVHSYSNWVLYPWGHARTQTDTPSQSFTSLSSPVGQALTPYTYREYMSGKDLLRFQTVSGRVIESVHRVWPPAPGKTREPEHTWWPKTIFDVYNDTTSGDTADYVYSRHLAESGRRKTYAFSLETGPNLFPNLKESFQPSDCESRQRIRTEIKAALLTLMEQTVCGIDHIGTVVLDRPQIVEAMAAMRDEGMAKTGLGREWLELFDRLQGPILSAVLADESLMNEAAGLFEAVASLIEDPSAKVTDDQIARGREFLRRLRKGMVPKLRRDLDAIDGRLAGMGRRTLGQVVGGLARRGPDRPSPTGKGSRQSENAKP